ncbi:MAG: tetratricopeptide repeat protein [Chloroflexota bacterium]
MPSYPDTFRRFITQSTQSTLEQVRASGALFDAGQREHVLHTLEFALDCADAWKDGCKILLLLEPEYRRTSIPGQWILPLERAIAYCLHNSERQTAASLYFYLGYIYQRQNNLGKARTSFQACADIFEALSMSCEQANALNRVAFILRLSGEITDSEALVQKALQLLKTDERREFSYFVLGMIAYDRGEYDKALEAFRQSVEIVKLLGNPLLYGQRLRNLGPPSRKLEQFEEAISCYEQAIELFTEINDTHEIAITKMNLGNVYTNVNRLEDALQAYTEAEATLRHSQQHLQRANLDLNIGIVQRMLENFPLAEQSIQRAVSSFRKNQNTRSLVNALDELAILYIVQEKRGLAEEALQEAKRISNQLDS